MSFPNVIFGDVGDEKVAASVKHLPLGTLMILPDGRKFRYARNASSATLIAGVVVGGEAETAGHGNVSGSALTVSATATENRAGARDIYLINRSTAVVKDEYADGFLNVNGPAGSSAYGGRVYAIEGNNSAAVSTRFKLTLKQGDALVADMAQVSTLCSLRKSKYGSCVVWAAGQPIIGTTPAAVSASWYFWAQRSGEASLWQSATVVVTGEPVTADTALAGSVTAPALSSISSTIWTSGAKIGIARGAAAASVAVIVDLTIE